ncbi:probable protein S-acyltransferase 22 [Sesamum indicum]|uniref:S-acyltransferase n=1 Tax=Sesamum indicum TaxID=4182 RepID=A0A6I9SXI6_SESIN|nr:probable protein S-acyltransferase 22 [Sesamum indicum]
MRKHGWQLPYHPLQVVAVAVFLALGFAFYVFFAPFVGKQLFQYIVMGIYTPLLICAFGLYIWCAGADPADPGVFRSKKYLNILDHKKHAKFRESKHGGESTSSIQDANAAAIGEEANAKGKIVVESAAGCNTEHEKKNSSSQKSTCFIGMLALLPCAYICNSHEESSDQQSEDGMFYCSLCEVEVFKYSKHCRVCDKCVDRFDHHCRWLNNCIGKRNYRKFFTLMVSALLLLILQWSTGILVLVLCFIEKKRFATDISSKLGSSFTVVPFVIVVAVCTILAMIATLPLAQLFFFHILLIKKGISTYDYIIALREQEQQGAGGQQSPQMSPASSLTGLSSASSFNTFHRAAWCTPPRLFVEDQFDVVPADNGSVSSLGKRTMVEEQMKKKNPAAVKISPWTLARLNAEDVSKAAAEARKKSKILRPVVRRETNYAHETDSSFGSSGRRMAMRPDNNRKRGSRRIRLPAEMPLEPLSKLPASDVQNSRNHLMITETSTSFAPLQLEGRSDFRASRAIPGSVGIVASSPESSFDSPDLHPFRVSSSGAEEARRLVGLSSAAMATQKDIPLSRSTSDGYDASGGEDSDRVPTRIQHRSNNWSSLLFGSEPDRNMSKFMPPSSSTLSNHRKL